MKFQVAITTCILFALAPLSPVKAEGNQHQSSLSKAIEIFNKTCVEVLVRQGGKGDLPAAFSEMGLTRQNNLYRVGPDSPFRGYINENYIDNTLICAIQFPKFVEKFSQDERKEYSAFLASMPGAFIDNQFGTPFDQECADAFKGTDVQTSEVWDKLLSCNSKYFPKRKFNGTVYKIMILSEGVGTDKIFHNTSIVLDFLPNVPD